MSTLSAVDDHGFLVLPRLLSSQETQRLIDDLEQSALRRSKAGVRHTLKHPSVSALAQEPRLLHIAQEILGGQAFAFRAILFDKSPRSNWLIVWHQDTALPLRERRETPWLGTVVGEGRSCLCTRASKRALPGSGPSHPSRHFHCEQWTFACPVWNAHARRID